MKKLRKFQRWFREKIADPSWPFFVVLFAGAALVFACFGWLNHAMACAGFTVLAMLIGIWWEGGEE